MVGIIKMEDRIVLLLDFETIIAEINPEINQKLTTVAEAPQDAKTRRAQQHVVVAEDSKMLRDLLVSTLHEAGYKFIRDFGNGQDAWDYLQDLSRKKRPDRKSCTHYHLRHRDAEDGRPSPAEACARG